MTFVKVAFNSLARRTAQRSRFIGKAKRTGGAAWGTRTHDPIITNDVLYQLS
jgi:hypothetical protein